MILMVLKQGFQEVPLEWKALKSKKHIPSLVGDA